jgi:hypothetical protein
MKRSLLRGVLLCTAPLLFVAFSPLALGDLVVNGGFEDSPDFNGWTVNDPSFFTNVGTNPAFAHSGNNKANLGATGLLGYLSQNIATTPGGNYVLSFWLANDVLGSLTPTNEFDVYWNGSLILSLTNAPAFAYTNYIFPNLFATGASTTLEFDYRNDEDFYRLDDVSVNVPDSGSTIWLAFSSLGFLCLVNSLRAKGSVRSHPA